MIRCWKCKKLINMPDMGEPTDSIAQTATESLTCSTCGSVYVIRVHRLGTRIRIDETTPTEEQVEKDRVWKTQ